MNGGAYIFAEPHIARIIRELDFKDQIVNYVGRKSLPVVATGISKNHKDEI
jgi:hypothetical protein